MKKESIARRMKQKSNSQTWAYGYVGVLAKRVGWSGVESKFGAGKKQGIVIGAR